MLLLLGLVLSTPKPVPPPVELGVFTIAATGDVMMHEAVKAAADAGGFDALFAQAAPILRSVDLGFGNLETPVAPKSGKGSHAFVFNAPPELLPALERAGFGLVLAANNHAYDQGIAGVAETVATLQDAGLPEIGAGRTKAEATAPVVLERHGIKVGFLGFTARFNDDLNGADPAKPYVAPAEAAAMAAAVSALAKTVDAVVVGIHWGQEYQQEPDAEQIALAKTLVDAGALVILGSHPHVLQKIELLPTPDGRVALVAYSLGNFISNQSREYVLGPVQDVVGDTRDGALLEVLIRKRLYAGGLVQTELGKTAVDPLWTDNNTLARKADAKARPDIHVTDIAEELKVDAEALTKLTDRKEPLSDADRRRAADLQKRIELLRLRESRISDRLGADFVPKLP